MKKSTSVALLSSLFVLAGFTACNKKFSPSTIQSYLQSAKNNSSANIEATVYAVAKDGYYVFDDTEKIFVSQENPDVVVGDKLQIEATYGLDSGRPYLKNATIRSKVSSDNTVITPSSKTIKDIADLDNKSKNGTYGSYYTVTGTIAKDNSNTFTLIDDSSTTAEPLYVTFSSSSKTEALVDYVGNRVDISVIAHSYNEGWLVTYAGTKEDILSNEITMDKLVNDFVVKKEIQPLLGYKDNKYADVYGTFVALPQNHETFTKVKYAWEAKAYNIVIDSVTGNETKQYIEKEYTKAEVDAIKEKDSSSTVAVGDKYFDNGGIEIVYDENGKIVGTKVTSPETNDVNVELQLTIKRGTEEQVYHNINIVNKAVKELSVKSFMETRYFYSYSSVCVKGVIIGKALNQSGSSYGFIIADSEYKIYSYQVEVTNGIFSTYELGDTITVEGYVRGENNIDRPSICNATFDESTGLFVKEGSLSSVEKDTEASKVNINSAYCDESCVLVIEDEEDFENYINNYYDQYVGKVVKFVNPTLTFKDLATVDIIAISYGDTTTAKLNNGTTEAYPCLVVSRTDALLGSSAWRYNIALEDGTDFEMDGSFYCIGSYTSSFLVMNIVNSDALSFNTAEEQVGYLAAQQFETEAFEGKLDLPATVNGHSITWTSSNTAVVANDGTITKQTTEIQVKLTGKFTVESVEKTFDVFVTVYDSTLRNVSDLTSANDSKNVLVQGYVVGYSGTNSYSAAGKARAGLVILDPNTGKLVYTNGNTNVGGNVLTGFTYSNSNDIIKVGDYVTVKGLYNISSPYPGTSDTVCNDDRAYLDLSKGLVVKATAPAGASIDLSKYQSVITVSSQTELENLVKDGIPFGTIIKFVSTSSNPLVISTTGSDFNNASDSKTTLSGIRFTYDEICDKDTAKLACTDVSDSYKAQTLIVAQFNNYAYQTVKGNTVNFFDQLGYSLTDGAVNKINGTNASAYSKATIGEFYATICYANDSYYFFSLVDPCNSFKLYNTDEFINNIDSSLDPLENVVLPDKFNGLDITWTSNNTEVINNNGTNLLDDAPQAVEVTMTATFEVYDGKTYSIDKIIKVVNPKNYTVSEAVEITDKNSSYKLSGVVVGFLNANGSAQAPQGLILSDGINFISLQMKESNNALTYDATNTCMKINGEKVVLGDYVTVSKLNVSTPGARFALSLKSNSAIDTTKKITNWTEFYKPNLNILTANSNDTLHSAIQTENANKVSSELMRVIKITGTSSSPIRIVKSAGKSDSATSSTTYKYQVGYSGTREKNFWMSNIDTVEIQSQVLVNNADIDYLKTISIESGKKYSGTLTIACYWINSKTYPHYFCSVIPSLSDLTSVS